MNMFFSFQSNEGNRSLLMNTIRSGIVINDATANRDILPDSFCSSCFAVTRTFLPSAFTDISLGAKSFTLNRN